MCVTGAEVLGVYDRQSGKPLLKRHVHDYPIVGIATHPTHPHQMISYDLGGYVVVYLYRAVTNWGRWSVDTSVLPRPSSPSMTALLLSSPRLSRLIGRRKQGICLWGL
jgi:hypothetical protein